MWEAKRTHHIVADFCINGKNLSSFLSSFSRLAFCQYKQKAEKSVLLFSFRSGRKKKENLVDPTSNHMLLSRTQAMHVSEQSDRIFYDGLVGPQMAHYISDNQSVLCKENERNLIFFGFLAFFEATWKYPF